MWKITNLTGQRLLIFPLHDLNTSPFTLVTYCILLLCGETSLFTIVLGAVTGTLPMSSYLCGNRQLFVGKQIVIYVDTNSYPLGKNHSSSHSHVSSADTTIPAGWNSSSGMTAHLPYSVHINRVQGTGRYFTGDNLPEYRGKSYVFLGKAVRFCSNSILFTLHSPFTANNCYIACYKR